MAGSEIAGAVYGLPVTEDAATLAEIICQLHWRRGAVRFQRRELNYRWGAVTTAPMHESDRRRLDAFRTLARLGGIVRDEHIVTLVDVVVLHKVLQVCEPRLLPSQGHRWRSALSPRSC